MNDNDQQQPMNGNEDLAKALDGGLQFEETPVDGQQQDHNTHHSDTPTMDPMSTPSDTDASDDPSTDTPADNDTPSLPSADTSDLDKLKAAALDDLRPLVGKLNLTAKEKFDTLLLIIRSTDDQSLLSEAHQAAKEITDDTERAQALLEVIKEADYFNSK